MRPTILTPFVVVLLAVSSGRAEDEPRPAADADRNIYLVDPLWLDVFDNWKPIGRTAVRLLRNPAFTTDPVLDTRIDLSKAGQMIHGVERRGLGLPLPQSLRFRLWMDARYLWVVLGDKAGRRVCSPIPVPLPKRCVWEPVELPLAQMVPWGTSAERIADLDMIAFLTQESAGPLDEGPLRACFSRIEAVYRKGEGPTNPTFTKQDLEILLAPLPAMIERIDGLLADARAKGIDTRYPMVSRTMLQRYRQEVFSMLPAEDPLVARRTAEFLLECARRTQAELETLIHAPAQALRVPEVSLAHLRVREGSFFAGDRPVILTGVCGWFSPDSFEQLAPMGYTALSIEIGPSSTLPSDNQTRPEAVAGSKAVLDAAAQHNMVCDLLVSPHYFPDWARKKWPGTDATNWRQQTNEFMPWTITDPNFRDVIAQHLSVLIPQVREHPALVSYDLINEAWYRPIPDFPAQQWMEFRGAHPEWNEWMALEHMTTQNVTDFLRWYIGELHRYDKTHPVQIKAIGTKDVLSVDREAIGDFLTANGMDAMPSWPDWTGRLAADFSWSLLRHDFHRSLQPDKPILDGEYHISGGLYPTPSAYFQAALWALALHGRDLTACWVFDRADAVSIYWHASGVETLGRTSLDLLRLGPEVHAFQRQRGPLALYYGGTATSDAYLACLFQDLDVRVITDRQILAGGLADGRLLVIPAGSEMPIDVRQRVNNFKAIETFRKDLSVESQWETLHAAVDRTNLPRHVRADQWGIECRSIMLGKRKLFYVLNHRRTPMDVVFRSEWNLTNAVDLRTQKRLNANQLRLQPLELRLIEAN